MALTLAWTSPSRPMTTFTTPPPARPRLAALRAELEKRGLDGFVVPHSDEHQGEYLPARAERLAWLTAFTGSAGAAVVLTDKAAIFVDGRYTLQVARPDRHHTVRAARPGGGRAAGLDSRQPAAKAPSSAMTPGCTPPMRGGICKAAAEKAGGTLVACDTNPIDAVWDDQPPPPPTPADTACLQPGRRERRSQAHAPGRRTEEVRRGRGGRSPWPIRSAGCSIFAARRAAHAFRAGLRDPARAMAAPICSWTRASARRN